MKRLVLFCLVAGLSSLSAEAAKRLPWRAEALAAMDYDFTVCGIRYKFPDRKLDWNRNPTYNNYREWPFQFARHSFLRSLAKYYETDRDERAAQTFVDIVTDFIDHVPPPPPETGPHDTKSWRTLDVGIRLSTWCDVYGTFAKSSAVTPEFKAKFRKSLVQHARRLVPERTYNNWRMAELNGLLKVSTTFPDLDGASEWKRIAEEGLVRQLQRQVYPDGFQYELSTGYHGFIHNIYHPIAKDYLRRGEPIPKVMDETMRKSYGIYEILMRPDGLDPALNDAGNPSARANAKSAYELFPDRKDFLWIATSGKEGERPGFLSTNLPYAGTVVFRNSWEPDAVWGCVDMSPFGYSHQHEDKLSFVLFAYGKEMLTEAGIYDYDTSEMRKYVLSTRGHNTIRIDGRDQYARGKWKWISDMLTQKAELDFSTTPEMDRARARFALGYGQKNDVDESVTHTRTVEFVKGAEPHFRIIDELVASDDREHRYEQLWHLESCEFDMKDADFTADFGDGVRLLATFRSENGKLVDRIGQKQPVYQGWLPIRPSGPHEHRPIHTPVLEGSFKGKTTIVAEFRPVRGKELFR